MATLVIVGTRETRVIARPGRSPLVYTPRAAVGGERMIEPGDGILDRVDRGSRRCGRPAQQNDLNPERAGCCDFAIGRAAAAVLGNDDLDVMRCHQRAVVGFAERAARGDVGHMRQWQWRIDRIDAADQITMLRRAGKWRELVAAERDKDAARCLADGAYRGAGIVHLDPAVAGDGAPRRPAQGHKRYVAVARGGARRFAI